mgnify:CR=1 FL=1
MLFDKLKNATKHKLSPLVFSVSAIGLSLTAASAPAVNAVSFDQQLSQLKQNNIVATTNKKQLTTEVKDLSKTVAELQVQVDTIDSELAKTTNKVNELTKTVVKTEKDLAKQRAMHALNQENRSKLEKQINETANSAKQLTKQLEREKQSQENLLADQKVMQQQLAKRRDESMRLIGLNREQQDAFEESVKANIDKIVQSERNKAVENNKKAEEKPAETPAKTEEAPAPEPKPEPAPAPQPKPEPVPGSAEWAAAQPSYPWANAPFPNDLPDPWGMFQRQCVSYTAWKVAQSGRHMPYWGGVGNANQWDDNARAAGIPVDTNPRVGDVAVMHIGPYGHVMYVEAVNPDGTIRISEYNYDLQGNYSERTISPAGLVFIHFP